MTIDENPPGPAAEIDSQAANFLARRANQSCWTAEDEAALEAWLSQSMAHKAAFWRLESVWNRADRLGALRALQPQHEIAPRSTRRRVRWAGSIAAVAVVAAIGAVTREPPAVPQVTTYATPIGGHETISLSDGSRIDLNTDTILRTRFTGGERRAELVSGEALFQIKHDPNRPFVVTAAGHRVSDIGTKFSIRAEGKRVEVALIEGSASISAAHAKDGARATILKPGDVAVANSGNLSVSRKPTSELESELSWRRGVLVFHRATLFEVAREYNRYNLTKIVIADQAAGNRIINATLSTNDVVGFARMARNFLGLHVVQTDDEVLISR